MHDTHARQLAGSKSEILTLIRQAALLIADRYGRDGSLDLPFVRFAHHAGFLVVHYRCEPNAMERRDGGRWNTRPGTIPDGVQHVVDIRIGEQVLGLGWRDNGPLGTDRFRRGPWEFELLKAAGLGIPLPSGAIRPAPAAPESNSRWVLDGQLDHSVKAMQVSRPLTFSVIGYSRCYSIVAEPGNDFFDLREMLEDCYGRSRTADGEVHLEGGPTTCFSLQACIGRRSVRLGRPIGRPGLRYFIGSDDGLSVAAGLLLAFDHDMHRAAATPISGACHAEKNDAPGTGHYSQLAGIACC